MESQYVKKLRFIGRRSDTYKTSCDANRTCELEISGHSTFLAPARAVCGVDGKTLSLEVKHVRIGQVAWNNQQGILVLLCEFPYGSYLSSC